MLALLCGRFHALTRTQGEWIARVAADPATRRLVAVVTSADHAGTRRNPLPAALREAILAPALERTGKPFRLVRVADVPESTDWVGHVAHAVVTETGWPLQPPSTLCHTANSEVAALFAAAGFRVDRTAAEGLTPHELIARIARGQPWQKDAAPETVAVYEREGVPERLRAIFAQRLVNDDGELAAHRDFASYGAALDAALEQKLADLLPWIVPGCIVDKGCGTGRLLCELARRFPDSAFVGVELSRELLRRADENTYAAEDVTLVFGDAAGRQVAPGSATTVLFASILHEVYSYAGYDRGRIDRALGSAARELAPGGRVLVRDGVSPGAGTVELGLLDAATRGRWERFAREFKHGQGAPHERTAPDRVRTSAHLANEFLCKKDYVASWDIEVNEEYGVLTAAEWGAALARAGLETLAVRTYVNPWIEEHRYRGKVELLDENGRALGWPATNVVAVGQRRA